jgi:hypothetical protein
VLLNLLFGHKTNAAGPSFRGVVEDIVHGEAVGVILRKEIELLLEQDILEVDIGINQAELSTILRVLQCCPDDLQHRRDTGATSDHANVTSQRWAVLELAFGSLDAHLVADLKQAEVARDVTLLVGLKTRSERDNHASRQVRTLTSRSKWPRSSSLLVGV